MYNDDMEKRIQTIDNWKKAHTKRYAFYINTDKEKDILNHFEKQTNKRSYLVNLIREDMEKGGN